MSSVKVYGPTISTCTMTVLFTAFELGHPVDLIPIDLQKGEHKQPSHVARNPFGKVPVAQDGDFIFYESRAIARYLVDKYTDASVKLVPSDIRKRAVFEQWMSLEATTFTPEVSRLLMQWVATLRGKPKDQAIVKQALDNLDRDGAILDKQLSGKQWIANNEFSLVDICMVTHIFPMAEEPEIRDWFKRFPHISGWYKNVVTRPAFQKIVALHKW